MGENQLVSFCIPTNGIVEWVFPVINTILNQGVDTDLFEIVITDNGNNEEFKNEIQNYLKKYHNIVYLETTSEGFLNQVDCFNLAKGPFVKFINHRALIVDGAVQHFVEFAAKYREIKPVVFFLNSSIQKNSLVTEYSDFDSFMRGLSYYSSWSGGLAFWKDKESISSDLMDYDSFFPHINVLFSRPDEKVYIIDNFKFMEMIDNDATKKGHYNLFYAFGVDYPRALENLRDNGKISTGCYEYILDQNESFLAKLYSDFVILKLPCSYDLSNIQENISVYYNFEQVRRKAERLSTKKKVKQTIKRLLRR